MVIERRVPVHDCSPYELAPDEAEGSKVSDISDIFFSKTWSRHLRYFFKHGRDISDIFFSKSMSYQARSRV